MQLVSPSYFYAEFCLAWLFQICDDEVTHLFNICTLVLLFSLGSVIVELILVCWSTWIIIIWRRCNFLASNPGMMERSSQWCCWLCSYMNWSWMYSKYYYWVYSGIYFYIVHFMEYAWSLICFEKNYCFCFLCQLHYVQVIFSDDIFLIAISSLRLVVVFFCPLAISFSQVECMTTLM